MLWQLQTSTTRQKVVLRQNYILRLLHNKQYQVEPGSLIKILVGLILGESDSVYLEEALKSVF